MTREEIDASMRRAIDRARLQLHLERKRAERITKDVEQASIDREQAKNAAKHAEKGKR